MCEKRGNTKILITFLFLLLFCYFSNHSFCYFTCNYLQVFCIIIEYIVCFNEPLFIFFWDSTVFITLFFSVMQLSYFYSRLWKADGKCYTDNTHCKTTQYHLALKCRLSSQETENLNLQIKQVISLIFSIPPVLFYFSLFLKH